jgi:hypothetical protein
MNAIIRQFVRMYHSDGAFTAAVLLAFGMLGTTTGMWFPGLG